MIRAFDSNYVYVTLDTTKESYEIIAWKKEEYNNRVLINWLVCTEITEVFILKDVMMRFKAIMEDY